jgi:putative flippase GtrA
MKLFLKFGVVGVFNTIITIMSYMLFVSLEMNYIVANIIAYSLGVLNSFYWNRKWVFNVKSNQLNIFWKFIIVNLITLGLNTLSLFILVSSLEINPIFGQVISTGIGMVVNFLLNKKWTFNY